MVPESRRIFRRRAHTPQSRQASSSMSGFCSPVGELLGVPGETGEFLQRIGIAAGQRLVLNCPERA